MVKKKVRNVKYGERVHLHGSMVPQVGCGYVAVPWWHVRSRFNIWRNTRRLARLEKDLNWLCLSAIPVEEGKVDY